MHNITLTKTVDNATETTVLPFEFETQEEIISFLEDYITVELSKLYDELKALGDRTFCYPVPAPHRALSRSVEGTVRSDGRPAIHGKTTVRVERVA